MAGQDFVTLVLGAETAGLLKGKKALEETTKAGANTDRAIRGLDGKFKKTGDSASAASKKVDAFTAASNRTRGIALAATKALAGMAAGYATFAAAGRSISIARDFNAAIAETSTLIEGTPAQLDAITAASRSMSKEFGGNATSQVKAFYQALSAGADGVAGATSLLDQANKLAIGGVTDVTTGVDALTTAMNAYGPDVLSAAQASDAMFVAMRAGKTTIGELAGSLGQIVPIASAAGVSFDEVTAGIAALTTQGLSTASATTGLRQVLASVIAPTKQATDAARALGIEFDVQAIKANGLAGFLDDVITKTGGNEAAMAQLFGSVEALGAALAFAGGAGGSFSAILTDMEQKAGATDAAYQKMADSLDQRWSKLTAAATDIALGFGNALLAVIVPAMEGVASIAVLVGQNVDVIGIALATIAATQIPAVVAGLVAMTAGMSASSIAAGVFTAAISAARVALVALGGPIGIIWGALGAGAAAWLTWRDNAVEGEIAAYDAAAGTTALHAELAVFADTVAPAAAAKAIDVANANHELAASAYSAAKGELAKRRAMLDMAASSGANGTSGSIRDMGSSATHEAPKYAAALKKMEAAEAALEQAMRDRKVAATVVTGSTSEVMAVTLDTARKTRDYTISLNTNTDALGGAAKAARGLANGMSAAEKAAQKLQDELDRPMLSAIDGVANAWGDFVSRGLTDFKSFAKSIISSFTGMISQMVAQAAKQKIMFNMGLVSSDGTPTKGGTSGAGFGGLGNMFKGGIFGKTGFFGSTGASIGKSLGSLIGGAGSKLAASLGSLGSAIGAAVPVIGAVVAAISFFKTKTTELNTGLRVTTEGMTALVDTFRTLKKVKFWGLSKKVTTTYDAASAEVADPIQSAIETIGERVMALSDTLGLASDNIKNTSFEFEISTKGKTDEQIQAAITAEMTRLGNNFADAAIGSYTEFLPDEAEIARIEKRLASMPSLDGGRMFTGADSKAALEAQKVAAQTAIEVTHLNGALAGLQREGEGSLAMLERIVGNLHGVNDSLYLFDRAALELGIEGAKAATALVDLSGGLEAFANNSTFVFENMMTSAAQEMRLTEIAAEKLNSGLGALGIAIPETHAEFMEMLNGQDLMTEAGRNTHAALLDVAQAFVQVNGTAQAAADAIAAQSAAAAQAAQNARAADVAAGLGVAKARADAANAAMADADAMLRAAFAAERQRLSGSQTTSIDTTSISARVGLFNTIRDALERAYTDRRVLTALGQKMRLTDATAFLRSAVSSGGTSDVDRLEAALDAVADPSTALFKSFADYQHDYNVNTNLIERLKGLTDDSLSVEEKTLNSLESQSSILQSNNASQLAALDAQMNALLGIDNSVLSLGDAIAGFQSAKDAVSKAVDVAAPASTQFAAGSFGAKLDAIYMAELGRGVKQAGLDFYGGHYVNGLSLEDIQRDIMGSAEAAQYAATGIPSFDGGGYTGNGSRSGGVDGRGGFKAILHPQEVVTDLTKMRGQGGGNDNRDVVAALNETNARLRNLQKEVNGMARISRDQNVNGTPGTRTGAVVATQEVV